MKFGAGERAVGGRQRAAKAREGDVIAFIPAIQVKTRHQIARCGTNIGGKPAPAVMPAKGAPGLNHQEPASRRVAVQRQCDQPAGEPAADDYDVVRHYVMRCTGLRILILG